MIASSAELVVLNERPVLITASSKYELGRIIIQSRFGVVQYGVRLSVDNEGVLRRTNDEVAVKVYSIDEVSNSITVENPMNELRAMELIGSHPRIMKPIEVCEDGEFIYSVMEYYGGGELLDLTHRYVDQGRQMSEDTARHYFRQIVEGCKHFHNVGMAHRDLSLENVLLSKKRDNCKIIDFGMSVQLQKDEKTGGYKKLPPSGAFGKINYVSPEMLDNESELDPVKGDIWALGVMLFAMISGCPPFQVASLDCKRFQKLHRYGTKVGLNKIVSAWKLEFSEDAFDLIQSMLSINQDNRPNADEILAHSWLKK